MFRAEAIEAVSTRSLGTVLLTQGTSFKFMTALLFLMALAIVIFLFNFSTTRKTHCQGIVTPNGGVIRVISSNNGTVKERRVREGQFVRAGEIMFILSHDFDGAAAGSPQRTISLLLADQRKSLEAEMEFAQQQSSQRINASKIRTRDLSEELSRMSQQVSLQERRVSIAEESVERYSVLTRAQYVSSAAVQDKLADLLDQRQRLAELQRQIRVTKREHDSAKAETDDLIIQAVRNLKTMERATSSLAQQLTESEARRQTIVRAPQDGTVAAITVSPGQPATANRHLATLLPSGAALEVELYVPSRSVGFVRPGMTVLLRYQAYPHQKFGHHLGDITQVADTSLNPHELGVGFSAGAEPLYRIRVRPRSDWVVAYGQRLPLKSGMLVDTSILLEKRRLYEWLLEPLLSVTGRLRGA